MRAHALVHFVHLLARREEHKRPAAAGFEDFAYFNRRGGREIRLARIGQVLGRIEQGLFGVIEMRSENLFLRLLKTQAPLQKIERAADRERGRSQDYRFDFVEQALA